MAVSKKELITLVRKAQSETDFRKRDELWNEIRTLGVPYDATTVDGVVIGKNDKESDHARG